MALMLTVGASANAGTPAEHKPLPNQELIQTNLLHNLKHGSRSIQASTIQLIIDLSKTNINLDLDFAVLPMLDLLKSSDSPEIRIISALGLYHLDSELGQFAVARRAQFDDSERVSNMCKRISLAWGERVESTGYYAFTE